MLKQAKYIFLVTLLVKAASSFSQTFTPSVVSSAGGEGALGGISITYSVGEPVITTGSSTTNFLTQGFQQPRMMEEMIITINAYSAQCRTSNDGAARVMVSGGTFPYTYQWSNNEVTDSVFALAPGDYTVTVTDAYGLTASQVVTVGILSDTDCEIHIYSGITPNGDSKNDLWLIDRIELFPENSVTIYNRWGDKVWQVGGYNNRDNVWAGNNQSGQPLPEGTYFYIVEVNGKIYKNWVEITR